MAILDRETLVRLEVLRPGGPVGSGRIQLAAGVRLHVVANVEVAVGSPVRLDGHDRIILAEAVAIDRSGGETVLVLEVEHLLFSKDMPKWSQGGSTDARADDAAGNR
jgi:hypothetical protein